MDLAGASLGDMRPSPFRRSHGERDERREREREREEARRRAARIQAQVRVIAVAIPEVGVAR